MENHLGTVIGLLSHLFSALESMDKENPEKNINSFGDFSEMTDLLEWTLASASATREKLSKQQS